MRGNSHESLTLRVNTIPEALLNNQEILIVNLSKNGSMLGNDQDIYELERLGNLEMLLD